MTEKEKRRARKEARRQKRIQAKENRQLDADRGEGEYDPSGQWTYKFHNDDRQTVVRIGKQIFNLVPANVTFKELMRREFKDIPHVRHLNPIAVKSREETATDNKMYEELHKTRQEGGGDKVTSLRKALAIGANVPEEVKKLMAEKDQALKSGDDKRAREIRRRLRKLDYKRYCS